MVQPFSNAVPVFRVLNDNVVAPLAVAGRLNVIVPAPIDAMVVLYLNVPLPLVVSGSAAPPDVAAT